MSQNQDTIDQIITELEGIIPEDSISAIKAQGRFARMETTRADKAEKELQILKRAIDIYERDAGESTILLKQNLELCIQQAKQEVR